jgi:hypothetical protein
MEGMLVRIQVQAPLNNQKKSWIEGKDRCELIINEAIFVGTKWVSIKWVLYYAAHPFHFEVFPYSRHEFGSTLIKIQL